MSVVLLLLCACGLRQTTSPTFAAGICRGSQSSLDREEEYAEGPRIPGKQTVTSAPIDFFHPMHFIITS